MRWLLVVLVLVPLVGAQQAVVSEPAGDVQGTLVTGESVDVPAGRGLLDLRGVTVVEEADAVFFTLLVESYDQAETGDSADFLVAFRYDTSEFSVQADIFSPAISGGLIRADFCRRPVGGQIWLDCEPIPVTVVPGSPAMIEAMVNRSLISNEVGLPATVGDKLEGFWAASSDFWNRPAIVGVPSPGAAVQFTDAMPDSLEGEGSITLLLGGEEASDVELTTLRPVRSSNGEEATFVYDVAITNRRAEVVEVGLSASELPTAWQVVFARDALRLEPGETRAIPVILSIPFRHEHGILSRFLVEAHDIDSGAQVGQLHLGVKFLDVPQPSGHHPTVFLHTARSSFSVEGFGAGYGTQPFMSTRGEEEGDTAAPVGPTGTDDYRAPMVYRWCIPLSTPMVLGIDFDTAEEGEFVGTLTSQLPYTGDLVGRLVATTAGTEQSVDTSVCKSRSSIVVLADLPTQGIELTGDGAEQPLEIPVQPALDVLPYIYGRQMYLELILSLDAPATPYYSLFSDSPVFVPGASMDLPLEEYHDPPPAVPLATTFIESTTPSRLYRNPGSVAVFNFTLQAEAGDFAIEVVGTHSDWARLEAGKKVGPGETFHLVVTVPDDASDATIADLVVKAVDERAGEIALAHAVVEVDKDQTRADDTAYASTLDGSRDAPSIPMFAVLVALLAAVLARRRVVE